MGSTHTDLCCEEITASEDGIDMRFLAEYREEFMRVYGSGCVYCGATMVLVPRMDGSRRARTPVTDHIVARSAGGSNAPNNLTVCCSACNCSKSGMDVSEFQAKRGHQIRSVETFAGLSTEGFEERRKLRLRNGPRAGWPAITFTITKKEKMWMVAKAKSEGRTLANWLRRIANLEVARVLGTKDDTRPTV